MIQGRCAVFCPPCFLLFLQFAIINLSVLVFKSFLSLACMARIEMGIITVDQHDGACSRYARDLNIST